MGSQSPSPGAEKKSGTALQTAFRIPDTPEGTELRVFIYYAKGRAGAQPRPAAPCIAGQKTKTRFQSTPPGYVGP